MNLTAYREISVRGSGQHRRPQQPLAERVAYRAAWIVGVPIKRWGWTRVGAVVGAAIASGIITGLFIAVVQRINS